MNWYETEREAFRQRMNRRVEALQRNNGITVRSDLSLSECAEIIDTLTRARYRRPNFEPTRRVMVPGDREVIRKARWHPASKLSVYLDNTSEEFQRDFLRDGVYVLVELTIRGEIPRYVGAMPKYVGMSIELSSRLKTHASGGFASNPADHVILEYLLEYATEAERAAYAVASRKEQQEIRRLAMGQRGLWVRTAHTADKKTADRLEHALIRKYEEQGYDLWNDIKYSTGT